jgi:hypothetical protein
MKRVVTVLVAIFTSFLPGEPSATSNQQLAHMLAGGGWDRKNAVALIAGRGQNGIQTLLAWTREPPSGVDQRELTFGLVYAFGELRTKEAIPFLIKNIDMSWDTDGGLWMKTGRVIDERLPAVHALRQIGSAASVPVIDAYSKGMTRRQRPAAIFVVSAIAAPGAREFLTEAMAEADLEKFEAAEGLRHLGHPHE